LVDVKGQLIGMYRGDDETKLYPIDISQDSWDAKPMPATDSTVSKGMITFDWAFNDVANQDKLRILNGSIVTADFLNVIGLIDVSVKVGAITSTSVTFTAMIENGSTSKIPLQGLTLTDILLNEPPAILQLATAIAPTSTVGQYIITMPSQTTADTLKLSISKNGFDFGTSKTVVIP
jgi:hypothetical protein